MRLSEGVTSFTFVKLVTSFSSFFVISSLKLEKRSFRRWQR